MNDQDKIIIKALKDRFKEISTWRVIPCSKCGGTGIIRAFKHVIGGTCFSCKGKGFFEEKWSTYRARMKRQEKKRREMEESQQKEAEQLVIWTERYKDDPRIGKKTRERMNKPETGDVFSFEVYELLDQWDNDPEWIKTRDHIRRNLAE